MQSYFFRIRPEKQRFLLIEDSMCQSADFSRALFKSLKNSRNTLFTPYGVKCDWTEPKIGVIVDDAYGGIFLFVLYAFFTLTWPAPL